MSWTNYEMKKHNMLKIFNTLRKSEGLSKRALAKASGVSWGTAFSVCNELLQKEIIIAEKGSAQNGRPPEILVVNPLKYLVLGIDINSIGLNFAVVNMAGKSIYSRFVPIENNDKDAILLLLKETTKSISSTFSSIVSVGLSMQGKLNKAKGVSIRSNYFRNWTNVDLVKFFSDEFNLPTYLYHDPECLLAYHKNNDARITEYTNGIALRIDNGIGMAQTNKGEIFESTHETTSELGHTISVPDGRPCPCGKNGCLESYSSLRGMQERYEELAAKKGISFLAAMQTNDEQAIRIYNDATLHLSISIANLFSLFSPDYIIVDGLALSQLPRFFDDLKERTDYFLKSSSNLIKANYNQLAPALGVAYLTIDKIIEEVLFL